MIKEGWRAFLGAVGAAAEVVVPAVFFLLIASLMILVAIFGADQLLSKGNLVEGMCCIVFVVWLFFEAVSICVELR